MEWEHLSIPVTGTSVDDAPALAQYQKMFVVNVQMASRESGCRNPIAAGFIAPLVVALLLVLMVAPVAAEPLARIQLPRTGLTVHDIAVIVNDSDPLSRQTGDYYQKARGIP